MFRRPGCRDRRALPCRLQSVGAPPEPEPKAVEPDAVRLRPPARRNETQCNMDAEASGKVMRAGRTCRKCGQSLFAHLPYSNLEFPDVRSFALEDPRAFVAQFPDGAVIDEVQRVPDLLSYLQGLIDNDPRPGRWIVTGSHNPALMESVIQSLAGRTSVMHLLPLTHREVTRFDRHPVQLEETLLAGGYPRIFDRLLDPSDRYRPYVATYLEREVRLMRSVGNLTTFERFVQLCAGRSSQLLNYQSMANDCGVSQPTVKARISLLEATFVAFRLPSYSGNVQKRPCQGAKALPLRFGAHVLAPWHPRPGSASKPSAPRSSPLDLGGRGDREAPSQPDDGRRAVFLSGPVRGRGGSCHRRPRRTHGRRGQVRSHRIDSAALRIAASSPVPETGGAPVQRQGGLRRRPVPEAHTRVARAMADARRGSLPELMPRCFRRCYDMLRWWMIDGSSPSLCVERRSAETAAGATSVFAKSFPWNSNGRPRLCASAYANTSPKFNLALW